MRRDFGHHIQRQSTLPGSRSCLTLATICLSVLTIASCAGLSKEQKHTVSESTPPLVVLHGLKRSSWSMKKIERSFRNEGHDVCNVDYPSARKTPEQLVDHIVLAIESCFGEIPERVNYITHSMGGIMVRAIAVADKGPEINRVVMLAPPNHGSELVDIHRNSALFRWTMGPVARYLGTDPGSLPLRLGPATFEVGIIAGTGRSNPLGAWIFNEPSDGTVSVASARLEGMKDFITVPYGHTMIMRKQPVIEEARNFLHEGEFSHQFKTPSHEP